MITRLREAGLLRPALVAIPAFAILIALGNWQWSRMHWKAGLLRQLEQASKAQPVPLRKMAKGLDPRTMRFRRVIIEGIFEHPYEMHVWAPAQSGPGWSVVTPLRITSGVAGKSGVESDAASHVFVIRGWVPAASKEAGNRPDGQVSGVQSVTGRVRLDSPNQSAPAPNLERNEWFSRDLKAMHRQYERAANAKVEFAPFFLEAEQPAGGASAPMPDLKALTLSNRHLEYALTWWGLAATLVGVFAAFAWSRLKQAQS